MSLGHPGEQVIDPSSANGCLFLIRLKGRIETIAAVTWEQQTHTLYTPIKSHQCITLPHTPPYIHKARIYLRECLCVCMMLCKGLRTPGVLLWQGNNDPRHEVDLIHFLQQRKTSSEPLTQTKAQPLGHTPLPINQLGKRHTLMCLPHYGLFIQTDEMEMWDEKLPSRSAFLFSGYVCFKNLLEFHWIFPTTCDVFLVQVVATHPQSMICPCFRLVFFLVTLSWKPQQMGCKSVGTTVTHLSILSTYSAANITQKAEVRRGEILSRWLKYKWASNTLRWGTCSIEIIVPVTGWLNCHWNKWIGPV